MSHRGAGTRTPTSAGDMESTFEARVAGVARQGDAKTRMGPVWTCSEHGWVPDSAERVNAQLDAQILTRSTECLPGHKSPPGEGFFTGDMPLGAGPGLFVRAGGLPYDFVACCDITTMHGKKMF